MRNSIPFGLAAVAAASLAVAAVSPSEPGPLPEAGRYATADTILDDATIVWIFDAANTADIETGRLAAERGSSKQVRDFGAMLVRDHEAVRQMGRDLAAKLGVTPTAPTDDSSAEAHAEAMSRLRSLSGSAFDRAFLDHEAAFHEAVIEAVESTLLPAIRNAELRALVVKVAPAFEAHRIAAENLAKQIAGGR